MSMAFLKALMEGDVDNAIVASTPGGIEAQEAEGQRTFVASDVLPFDFRYCKQEHFEQIGIVFGEKVDDLFIEVQLPEGWKKVATNHSMWSDLVDERGRKRASIFYKAAFYDRSAHMFIVKRYTYSVQPKNGWDDPDYIKDEWQCVVTDADEVIWKSETIEPEPKFDRENREPWDDWSKKKDKLGVAGKEWLDENYPEWENPVAYW